MFQKLDSEIAVIGIDIGKNSFHLVGQDRRGSIVLRQKWSRGQVEARLANLQPCLIGMEACVGAHHLSRKLQALGHDARLMPAKYVRPYSKGEKNDYRDAEAIAEAVQRPTMKFVATKTADQLDLQALHRVRERPVSQRTGIINQIRAFLLERGVAVRQGLRFLRAECRSSSPSALTSYRLACFALSRNWPATGVSWTSALEACPKKSKALARQDPACERLITVPGIGPIISSAIVAAIGKGAVFTKGRDFGARLGLVPKQNLDRRRRSWERYRGAAIAISGFCSCRQLGSCWSGSRTGTGTGSKPGSTPPKRDCTAMCWRSRLPTSLPASHGRF